MSRLGNVLAIGILAAVTPWGAVGAQPLTADRAAEIALKNNSQVVNAEAIVLDARSGVQGAYSSVLPRLSADVSRSGSWTETRSGSQIFGGFVSPIDRSDLEQYSTAPSLSGTWPLLNFSSLAGLSSARSGLRAARAQQSATRNDVVLSTKRQFYEVVRAEHLSRVANGALRLAHDDERRVRALFEVGSVSRSDLLKAQVRTAQAELDSLTARQNLVNQRIVLAVGLGMREAELGEVDTTLTAEAPPVDSAQLLAEAERNRPDLMAADAEVAAARSASRSAQFLRLPYLTVSAGLDYRPRSSFKVTTFDTNGVALPQPFVESGRTESDLSYSARASLSLDLFTGFTTESRITAARARLLRAQETRDALRRNLGGEVEQALLAYNEAVERQRVARRAVESATENLKLTQEKYNVGSATILELIDAQVQLQRAQSDMVSALAAIRVAEAQIERVRGRAQ